MAPRGRLSRALRARCGPGRGEDHVRRAAAAAHVHVRRRDGHARMEVAAVVVPGRPERRGDPARRRATVRGADGGGHDRGRERTLRDGLPPPRDARADRDRGERRRGPRLG